MARLHVSMARQSHARLSVANRRLTSSSIDTRIGKAGPGRVSPSTRMYADMQFSLETRFTWRIIYGRAKGSLIAVLGVKMPLRLRTDEQRSRGYLPPFSTGAFSSALPSPADTTPWPRARRRDRPSSCAAGRLDGRGEARVGLCLCGTRRPYWQPPNSSVPRSLSTRSRPSAARANAKRLLLRRVARKHGAAARARQLDQRTDQTFSQTQSIRLISEGGPARATRTNRPRPHG